MAFPNGIADFRSDTVTHPTDAMRSAMASAEVGDDVYGEDPTINALEEEVAGLLGKQAALFTPSGTMANQLALGTHTNPGDEVICVETAHVRNYEHGGASANFGLAFRTVPSPDGEMSVAAIETAVAQSDSLGVVREVRDQVLSTNACPNDSQAQSFAWRGALL